jgi:hypothetical protein
MSRTSFAIILATATALAHPGHAEIMQLITNGGFETGDLTGWTAHNQPGGYGLEYAVANAAGTVMNSSLPYLANRGGGSFFAIIDEEGITSNSIIQPFTVSQGTSNVSVAFDLFASSLFAFTTAPARDYNATPNQNAEVDILTGNADPFTSNPSDIIATLYGPGADSGAPPRPWITYTEDLGAMAPGTYQIRFAQTVNLNWFQVGVDNVSVLATVPEPVSIASFVIGLAGLCLIRRRGNADPAK